MIDFQGKAKPMFQAEGNLSYSDHDPHSAPTGKYQSLTLKQFNFLRIFSPLAILICTKFYTEGVFPALYRHKPKFLPRFIENILPCVHLKYKGFKIK